MLAISLKHYITWMKSIIKPFTSNSRSEFAGIKKKVVCWTFHWQVLVFIKEVPSIFPNHLSSHNDNTAVGLAFHSSTEVKIQLSIIFENVYTLYTLHCISNSGLLSQLCSIIHGHLYNLAVRLWHSFCAWLACIHIAQTSDPTVGLTDTGDVVWLITMQCKTRWIRGASRPSSWCLWSRLDGRWDSPVTKTVM